MDNKNEMTIKDYIKLGFISLIAGVGLFAGGLWMYSDGDTFPGFCGFFSGTGLIIVAFFMFKNAVIKIRETITDAQKRKLKIVLSMSACGIVALSVCIFMLTRTATDKQINTFMNRLDSEYYDVDDSDNVKMLQKCLRSENFAALTDDYVKTLFLNEKYEDIAYLINNLRESGYDENHIAEKLDQLILEAVKSSIKENNLDKSFSVIKMFSDYGYHSVNVKKSFADELNTVRTEALSGNDGMKMIAYVELVKEYLDNNYYTSIIECFPYQEMKSYIETHGTKVILENGVGGYYDSIQDQYENKEYWYSPLFEEKYSRGSVGTYRYTERYEFYGDLMSRFVERYWYDTSYSDPNNSKGTSWYYKGKDIGNSDEIGIGRLIRITAEAGSIECLYSIENSDEIMLCAIEGAYIHIIHNYEMVTIAYK